MTITNWKLKPIKGFRFPWKGSLEADPFQTVPTQNRAAFLLRSFGATEDKTAA